jgi:chloride channel 7
VWGFHLSPLAPCLFPPLSTPPPPTIIAQHSLAPLFCVAGLLTLNTLICKLVGLVCSMTGGLIAGKEGPFVHAGAIVGGGWAGMGSQGVAAALARWGGWTPADAAAVTAAPREWGGYFRSDAEHRDFVFIGAAAGE